MVQFTVKERLVYRDLQPLLNEWSNQTQYGMINTGRLITMYICTCTDLKPEQVEELTIEEFEEVMNAVLDRYPLDRILAPFLKLAGSTNTSTALQT